MKKLIFLIIIFISFSQTNVFAFEKKYAVREGDNLSLISEIIGLRVDEIIKWNPQIIDENIIYVGDSLIIPKIETSDGREVARVPKFIIVNESNTLIRIAKTFFGDRSLYKKIADRNNISGPEYIIYVTDTLYLDNISATAIINKKGYGEKHLEKKPVRKTEKKNVLDVRLVEGLPEVIQQVDPDYKKGGVTEKAMNWLSSDTSVLVLVPITLLVLIFLRRKFLKQKIRKRGVENTKEEGEEESLLDIFLFSMKIKKIGIEDPDSSIIKYKNGEIGPFNEKEFNEYIKEIKYKKAA